MDIARLQEHVSEQSDGDSENGLRLLMAKLGQLSEISLKLEESNASDAKTGKAMSDLLSGLFVIVAHAAEEQGVDLNDAVEARVEEREEQMAQKDELEEAMEALDYERIADMLGLLEGSEPEVEADELDDKRMFN